MDNTELGILEEILIELLTPNNEERRAAEVKLDQVRSNDPNKYSLGMLQAIADEALREDARALGFVLFRGGITADPESPKNVWGRISNDTKEQVKSAVLNLLKSIKENTLAKQIADLASEVSEVVYIDTKELWTDLLELAFQFVSCDSALEIRTGLNIYNFLFAHQSNELSTYNDKFVEIFKVALEHPSLEVASSALSAVCNYLSIAQSKFTKCYKPCLPGMVQVPLRALAEGNEGMIEDAMVEFNNVAEAEPKFFVSSFKDIFLAFTSIVEKNDYDDMTLRHQPLEFLVSITDRQTSLITKDEDVLKGLLDLITKLMIDIDAEVDENWLNPPPGFKLIEEQEDDAIVFAMECINRIFHAGGEDAVLGPVCVLIENLLANETDWRFKNAGLHILSQIGDFVDEVDMLRGNLMDTVIRHLTHENPMIRHATCHMLGQLANDLKEKFTEEFHPLVVKPLVEKLTDPVVRVQAHAAAAISNFFENVKEDIGIIYVEHILPILIEMIRNGSSIVKENAVAALSSLAESCKINFAPYYQQTMELLVGILTQNTDESLKQFKGQLIETVTIMSVCVGLENFRQYAPVIIQSLLQVQNTQLNDKVDPQRSYLLAAWQRLCLVMEDEFVPYLKDIIPSLFSLAALKPNINVESGDSSDILEYLAEIKVSEDGKTVSSSVNTDQIEDKNIAIQMLTVFIDELEEGFVDYIRQTSELFVSMINYEASEDIRNSVANSLPTMLKCLIKAHPENRKMHEEFAFAYMQALFKAMNTEGMTDTMVFQILATKDIIKMMGSFMDEDTVNKMCVEFLELIAKSDRRKDLNLQYTMENENSDDEIDDQNRKFMQEEDKVEDELQIAISETFGVLFQTHKECCQKLVETLFTQLLPIYLGADSQFIKKKFALFVIVDLIEHLGLERIDEQQFKGCFDTLLTYAKSDNPILRQACNYGFGIIAKFGGEYFGQYTSQVEEALNYSIEMKLGTQKKDQFHHAYDNALSSLGKVLKYQSNFLSDSKTTFSYFIDHLPIQHDNEEAKEMNEFLADGLLSDPQIVLGEGYPRVPQIIGLLGEQLLEKYMTEETMDKFKQFFNKIQSDQQLSVLIQTAYEGLEPFKQERIKRIMG